MTRLTLFAALFAMAANAGLPTAAQAADACDLMVAKLTASDGVQFERRTDEGTIFLKHPLSNALTIECEPGWRSTSVYVGWPNAFPTAAFYTLPRTRRLRCSGPVSLPDRGECEALPRSCAEGEERERRGARRRRRAGLSGVHAKRRRLELHDPSGIGGAALGIPAAV